MQKLNIGLCSFIPGIYDDSMIKEIDIFNENPKSEGNVLQTDEVAEVINNEILNEDVTIEEINRINEFNIYYNSANKKKFVEPLFYK
jgi:hypothetical protein